MKAQSNRTKLTISRIVETGADIGCGLTFMPGDIISAGKESIICRRITDEECPDARKKDFCEKCVFYNDGGFMGIKCHDVYCGCSYASDPVAISCDDVYFERIDL